jgi:hypothetical protein
MRSEGPPPLKLLLPAATSPGPDPEPLPAAAAGGCEGVRLPRLLLLLLREWPRGVVAALPAPAPGTPGTAVPPRGEGLEAAESPSAPGTAAERTSSFVQLHTQGR